MNNWYGPELAYDSDETPACPPDDLRDFIEDARRLEIFDFIARQMATLRLDTKPQPPIDPFDIAPAPTPLPEAA